MNYCYVCTTLMQSAKSMLLCQRELPSINTVMFVAASLIGSCSVANASNPEGNLIKNPGFEQAGTGIPPQWISEEQVRHKGKIRLTKTPGGGMAVTLSPNAKNIAAEQNSHPLSVGQVIALRKYPGLRGTTLHVSARMGATKPATAKLRLIAIRQGGELIASILEQGDSAGKLIEQSASLRLPDDNKTLVVVLGLDANGTAGEVTFDDVYLSTRPKQPVNSKKDSEPVGKASIRIDASKARRKIPESLYGMNLVWVWDGEGLWDDKKKALNEDIVRLTQELRPTLLRFPGGTFSDFYHWRDGIGPHYKRPTTKHLPEGPTSKHNIGTDEALQFADLTGSELMITVNIATGTPKEAVEWLRYVNKPNKTSGQPPKVKFWEIGNENYYYSDTPYLKQAAHNSKQYARRVLTFAKALKKADPRIKIVAIAQESFERDFKPVHSDWIPVLLSKAGHVIDYLALHNGYVPGLEHDNGEDVRTLYRAMLAAPIQLRESLDRVTEQIRKVAPKHASRIKLAITEWAPSFQIVLDGRYLDHPKTLGSALFVASNLKNYIEHPNVEVANFFKLNGRLWQNMIGTRNNKFIAKAPYYAFLMYREHFGSILIETQTESPSHNTRAAGYVSALKNVPYLDVVSSLSDDGKQLYIMVVNKHFDQPITAQIEIAGFEPQPKGHAYVLSGTGIDANTGTQLFKAPGVKWARQAVDEHNARFYKGGPGEISITEHPITVTGNALEYSFGKHSVTAIEMVRVNPHIARKRTQNGAD